MVNLSRTVIKKEESLTFLYDYKIVGHRYLH